MRIREISVPSGGAASTTSLAGSQVLLGAAASAAGIAASQAPTNATPLTLTGAAAALSPPRKLTITSTANLSAITFHVVGLDQDGNAQTEDIVGPNNNTVTGTLFWSSVTSITPNGTNVGNLTVGWPATTGTMLTEGIILTGAAASIAVPREVTLSSGSNLSAINFTITGTDRRGNHFSEVIAGPNNGDVTTKGVFGSVESIVPSATSANSVSAGLVIGGVSPWFLHNTIEGRDELPNGSSQVLAPAGTAGKFEYTHQNAARIVGEGAQVDADPSAITGTLGEVTVLKKRPWFRVRNTAATGTLKVAVARPRF